MTFKLHVAMGDPQAPFATVRAVLARHGLLGPQGRLRPDVQLVSMGDHFDWGPPEQRPQATADALALLAWLTSHPPEQVVLLAGNHDLARVCELWPFGDDEAFEAAYREAAAAYRAGAPDEAAQRAFLARYPHVPDAECVARDFSCFSADQRRRVEELVRSRRFRLAHAHAGLLCVHAGVTAGDFRAAGRAPTTAEEAAAQLNQHFDAAIAAWGQGPFDLPGLHRPGSASGGVARGVLFHRPAKPVDDPQFHGPPRRRFDPRDLPAAFPQAIGHIRDKKARELLREWAAHEAPEDGPLRSLLVEGEAVRYQRGVHPDARLYFLDAGMLHVAPERYELFDLDRRVALSPARTS